MFPLFLYAYFYLANGNCVTVTTKKLYIWFDCNNINIIKKDVCSDILRRITDRNTHNIQNQQIIDRDYWLIHNNTNFKSRAETSILDPRQMFSWGHRYTEYSFCRWQLKLQTLITSINLIAWQLQLCHLA